MLDGISLQIAVWRGRKHRPKSDSLSNRRLDKSPSYSDLLHSSESGS